MGIAGNFEKEKLIVGLIWSDERLLAEAVAALEEAFGPIEDESEEFSFSKDFSTYYDEELGGEGRRKIVSFRDTVSPDRQAEIKKFTNSIEAKLAVDGNRRVNIDPGFLSRGRLMLATTKEASFRIPLSDGIYTELTLFFARGTWQRFPWTYRDYQSPLVQKFLTRVRKTYLSERKSSDPNENKSSPAKK